MRRGFFRTLAPFAAIAALGALSGCGWNWDDGDGVPLAELDLSGEPPQEVALLGPDTVAITDGAQFAITVDGDSAAVDKLRFKLEGGRLGIMRDSKHGDGENSTATVRITMPAPRKLSVAGSGSMRSERLAANAEVSIAGSGDLETPAVEASSLRISIAGSGSYLAGGRADALELSIAGSGSGRMARLNVDNATINVAGSGDAVFASDGNVRANIVGSGTVTVRGSARCKVNTVGSGSLVCEREPEPVE